MKGIFKKFIRKSSKDSCVIYEDWEFLQQYPESDKRSRSNESKSAKTLLSINKSNKTSVESLPLTENEIFENLEIGKTSTLKSICSENYNVAFDDLSDNETDASYTSNPN